VIIASLALMVAHGLDAQEVIRLSWPTRHAAPPVAGTAQTAVYLPVLRAGIARLPESSIVSLALKQGAALGLSKSDAAKLDEGVSRRYAAIAASPVFKDVPSALGYCFAETRPTRGLASLYRPRNSDARTPVIVFVHGYGGAFLWYQHQLAEWFPDHLILCPAYGTDPSDISGAYLDECLAAAAAHLKHPLAKPSLVGLSAGGFGASRAYVTHPARYRQLVVLAAYPPDDAFQAWPRTARAGFLVGELEYHVKDGGFSAFSRSLAARSASYQGVVIPKADHFFLLTHPAESRRALRAWLAAPGK